MKRFFRGATIVWVVLRFGLDELVLTSLGKPWLRRLAGILAVGRDLRAPRGQRLREALERLGPIFVKFGQVLSTRRDLMPPDIADELALLQDRVPPFDSAVAVATITEVRGSVPREVGAKMIIHPLGQHYGTVGGGCGEGDVIRAALDVLQTGEPATVHVDLTEDPTMQSLGVCGGIFNVFVERWEPNDER